MSAEKLFDTMTAFAADQQPNLVGITGYPGSGKSTLAELLKDKYQGTILISTDWFFYHSIEVTRQKMLEGEMDSNLLTWTDEQRLTDTLKKLATGKDVELSDAWNQQTGNKDLHLTLPGALPGTLIIVEGLTVLSPSLAEHLNFTILLDEALPICFQRSIKRDAHRLSEERIKERLRRHEKLTPLISDFRNRASMVINPNHFSTFISTNVPGSRLTRVLSNALSLEAQGPG